MRFRSICKMLLILSSLFYSVSIVAQQQDEEVNKDSIVVNPPVNVETLIGSRGVTFNMLLNKKFQSLPKVGFFSVVNYVGEWGEPDVKDRMIQGQLTYTVIKGLDVTAGFHYDPEFGVKPAAGLLYTWVKKDWVVVLNGRVDIMSKPAYEGMALVEYTPKLNDTFKLYTRAQGLYGYATEWKGHSRSYIQGRVGLSYKEFSFGVATNIDFYGPLKVNENSFGGFVTMLLF